MSFSHYSLNLKVNMDNSIVEVANVSISSKSCGEFDSCGEFGRNIKSSEYVQLNPDCEKIVSELVAYNFVDFLFEFFYVDTNTEKHTQRHTHTHIKTNSTHTRKHTVWFDFDGQRMWSY